jgi:hypothetical protein
LSAIFLNFAGVKRAVFQGIGECKFCPEGLILQLDTGMKVEDARRVGGSAAGFASWYPFSASDRLTITHSSAKLVEE